MYLPIKYEEAHSTDRKRAREQYALEQDGRCWFCRNKLSDKFTDISHINLEQFPVNFFKYPVHLHHDHDTGLTLGAVHAYCNAVLWQFHGQ